MNNEIEFQGAADIEADLIEAEIQEEATYIEAEVTTMNEPEQVVEQVVVEEKPAKAPRAKKPAKAKTPYPFDSKAQILARVADEASFMLQCLQILDFRQTSDEQQALQTKYRNARGWMSSHAVNAGKLAQKARTEGLAGDEFEQARSMVLRYGKQLAEHFREERIQENPELARVAALFSV